MPPRAIPATLFHQDTCVLAEGPFWHDRQLWWVDIEGGALLSADPTGKLIHNIPFGQRIGSATPAEMDRTFLVALEREVALFDLNTKTCQTIARPEGVPENGRFNDGKCDPAGRWIGGTMNPANETTCSLYSLRHDHSLQILRKDITISNGLAWSADGRILYYIDTPALCVFAYDYDVETGAISGERIVLRFAEKDGWPDGMTIDREGRLWIAFWEGGAVRCYRPQTGICEAVVPLNCSRVTSCCFGGDSMDLLFITTARQGFDASEIGRQPLAGSVFVCDPGAKGFQTTPFRSVAQKGAAPNPPPSAP